MKHKEIFSILYTFSYQKHFFSHVTYIQIHMYINVCIKVEFSLLLYQEYPKILSPCDCYMHCKNTTLVLAIFIFITIHLHTYTMYQYTISVYIHMCMILDVAIFKLYPYHINPYDINISSPPLSPLNIAISTLSTSVLAILHKYQARLNDRFII